MAECGGLDDMKRILKVIGVGVIIGIMLVIVQIAFNIPKDIFLHYYWICGVAVVLVAVIFNYFYNLRYQKKMKDTAMLLENGKTKEYIQVVEVLLKNAKGRYLKKVLTVNLSAGYCRLNEYEKAIELLESLLRVRLYGVLKMVHRLNLCVCYFYSHQGKKAIALYESSQKDFKPFKKSKLYGGNIAVLDVFAAIEKGELTRAQELLKSTREEWENPRLQDDYQYLEEILHPEQRQDLE